MRYLSKRISYGFFVMLLLIACKNAPPKPNILFIFADDQAYNTIHALGNEEITTPALDKLAEEGMTFTNAYNMGAWHGAVCVASRTMLNTGRFVWNAYKNEKKLDQLAGERKLWSQMMEDAGYETYFSGKWHVKISPDSIFNHTRHIRPGMPKAAPEGYNRPIEGQEDVWSPYDTKFGGFWAGGKHWSEVLADDAEEYIAMASKSEKPFFMYLAFNAPHDPRQSPREFVDMYPYENIKVPENFLTEYPYNGKIGYGRTLRDERLAPFPRTEYAVKVNRQEYYAIITHMDRQILRIINALEKSGKKEHTYIFFSADHGLACGNHGLLGKQNMYDHSIRPPMIVAGPDIPQNKRSGADVYLQDIMASVLEIAGIEKPQYVEFNSFIDLATGKASESHYEAIYGCYTDAQRMIRKDGFKLIAYPKAEVIRLFDLQNDPLEMNDLIGNEEFGELKQTLFNDLLNLQERMKDTVDLKEAFPNLVL
ncbi:MAG: sulfatase-like hydrolase/transferase [Cytophagales bacterium]|nr:sulfatase-like hydrolase/transferase [Cytophagales bacterium]